MALNKKITAMVLSTLISTSVFAQSADPCVKLELAQEKAHSELLKVERESKQTAVAEHKSPSKKWWDIKARQEVALEKQEQQVNH